jgi:hypothetical protein
MVRLIEFAIETNINSFSPSIILLDCSDIVGFEQIYGISDKCRLITKQNRTYTVYGTYRTLTNRFLYALNKKLNFHEDFTIRPSIGVIHKPELLEIDVSFFDKIQLKAFIFGLEPNFNINRLSEHTKEDLEL